MEQFENYNLIDVLVVFIMAVALLVGLWKGFVRTLTAVAGVVIGILASTRYHLVVEPYLSRVSSLDPYICTILSMIILFILVQAAFVLIRKALDIIIDFTRLGWLDRILGAGVGILAGLLFVACIAQFLVLAVPEWPAIRKSKLIAPIEQISRLVTSRVPEKIKIPFRVLTEKWKGTFDIKLPSGSAKSEQVTKNQTLIHGRVR